MLQTQFWWSISGTTAADFIPAFEVTILLTLGSEEIGCFSRARIKEASRSFMESYSDETRLRIKPRWNGRDFRSGLGWSWYRQAVEAQLLNTARCEMWKSLKIWPTRPSWLIDIENKCIVPGHGCHTFVALSYMWGKDPGFRFNTAILEKLQLPNALEIPEISIHLAPIIGHAMYLTFSIGERYLWVDILCIVHGDDAATAEQ